MLPAVNMGRLQSPSLVLSRRRVMRRLLLASFRVTVAFTRNPSWLRGSGNGSTLLDPGSAGRFRVFFWNPAAPIGGSACLRSSEPVRSLAQGQLVHPGDGTVRT